MSGWPPFVPFWMPPTVPADKPLAEPEAKPRRGEVVELAHVLDMTHGATFELLDGELLLRRLGSPSAQRWSSVRRPEDS